MRQFLQRCADTFCIGLVEHLVIFLVNPTEFSSKGKVNVPFAKGALALRRLNHKGHLGRYRIGEYRPIPEGRVGSWRLFKHDMIRS